MTYEIITRAAEEDISIGRRNDYSEIEQDLLAAFSEKAPLETAFAHGARKFSIYDNARGVEVKVFEIDDEWTIRTDTLENISEKAVLEQPSLIPSTVDEDFDDWADDTGLDQSFYGSETEPGTADLFDAAIRIRAQIDLGLIPDPTETPAP